MTYHGYGSLGASASANADAADNAGTAAKACLENLRDYDYDSPEGRRAANKEAGRCAAEAVCAYYTGGAMPQGWCGGIGGKVAEIVGDIVEGVADFLGIGGPSAEEIRAQKVAWMNSTAKVDATFRAYNALQQSIVDTAQIALIDAWDATVPGQKGKLGSSQKIMDGVHEDLYAVLDSKGKFIRYDRVFGGDGPLTWKRYRSSTTPAGYLLQEFGADIYIRPLCQTHEDVPFMDAPPEYCQPGSSGVVSVFTGHLMPNTPQPHPTASLKNLEGMITWFTATWLPSMKAAVGKATAFVTAAATREQAKIILAEKNRADIAEKNRADIAEKNRADIAEKNRLFEAELISSELVGVKRSQALNLTLLGVGIVALGGAFAYSRKKGH